MKQVRILIALVVLAFFVVFHAGAVRAQFADDETMNLYGYWLPGAGRVALAHIAFWSKFIRPMGALYYLPVFGVAGLNPAPYNIVRILILLVNTVLFYKLALVLGRSWWIAIAATFAVAYHAGLGALAYDGAFIYDVLCGGFYFAALLYYVRVRRQYGRLNIRQVCVFLALYVCALNSKEMAVSLPAMVLAYEFLFDKRGGPARFTPALIACAITVVFIAGKTIGPGALTSMPAYRPVLSWARFLQSNTRFINTIFYTDLFTPRRVLITWAVLLYVSLRSRDPRWMFLWIWVVVTPLPIAFLPDRGGATLYIVTAGWAMLAAMIARTLVRRLGREPVAAGLPRRYVMAAGLVVFLAAYVHETWRVDRRSLSTYQGPGEKTREVIAQLKALNIQPKPGSRIVFLNDPLSDDGFGTEFIAYLLWNDHSLKIALQRQIHFTEDKIRQMDYVFDFVDGRLIQRKP